MFYYYFYSLHLYQQNEIITLIFNNMDWTNVNLNSNYERSQNMLDAYDFETLLLEISCNLKEINKETVTKQFYESLSSKIECAKEVFRNNLENILNKAIEERENN